MNRRRTAGLLLTAALLAALLLTMLPANSPVAPGDELSRRAIQALSGGSERKGCGNYSPQEDCSPFARLFGEGLPPLPQGPIAVGDALSVESAMDSIHLLPVEPRGNDGRPEDSLIVRVADGQMWLDFAGKDRSGLELTVSIALDSEGGRPVKLVAKAGTDVREIQLAGRPLKSNDGRLRFLAPEAGSNPRFAHWLDMPKAGRPKTYELLAGNMRSVDPAFMPRIARAVFDGMAAPVREEEALGLYPALRSIDEHADFLRAAHVEGWLPQGQIMELVQAAYPDSPALRASWALALCESGGSSPVIDRHCWNRFTGSDADVTSLLRNEVAQLQDIYQPLAPSHPLRLRLERLSAALRKTDAESPDKSPAPEYGGMDK